MIKNHHASFHYSYPKELPVIKKNKFTQTDESCFGICELCMISNESLNEMLKEYCVKQKFPNCLINF
ncbi:unnamed protein product [Meloidogyne enterolobii]|uniref:Uncharacterized protein n=1 Tax=Meloidogyne enterolobii TaxID=390850 RepID=A0ACB0XV64_MELEN